MPICWGWTKLLCLINKETWAKVIQKFVNYIKKKIKKKRVTFYGTGYDFPLHIHRYDIGHVSAPVSEEHTKLTITNRHGVQEPQAWVQSGNLEPATCIGWAFMTSIWPSKLECDCTIMLSVLLVNFVCSCSWLWCPLSVNMWNNIICHLHMIIL